MPVSSELLEILVCPETLQPLTPADEAVLAQLNREIEAGRLSNRGGDPVKDRIAEGLVREDGRVLYVVADDIPVMLVDESIELQGA